MNPLFRGISAMQQGNNMMQIVNMARKVQKDPSQLPKILLDNNRISKEQYEQLLNYNGNPQAIGEYLVQNGLMQNPTQMNPMVAQIQSMLK